MLEELSNSLAIINSQTQKNLPILGIILAVLWSAYFINIILSFRLLRLGIFPRHIIGLRGIIFAPFLHGNFNHLFFNTIPLLVLSNFILITGIDYFLQVTVLIDVISGFLIWCFAKQGLHIGASAVITGYWGLLVTNIFHQGNSLVTLILGIICLYYFAGIFLGIFPGKKGVSWEGHLFGLVAGLITSFYGNQILNWF